MKLKLRPIDRIFIGVLGVFALVGILLASLIDVNGPSEQIPMIAYLGDPLENPEIWLAATDGTGNFQITNTDGKVYDFSVSPDGETLVYSVLNDAGGSDLYTINRGGVNAVKMVECNSSLCIQPAWSSDGLLIAYSQYFKGLEGEAEIKVIRFPSGELFKFRDGEILSGAFSSFSPDGQLLAFFSFADGGLHVLDLKSGIDTRISTQIPEMPSWSNDSNTIFFTEMVSAGELPQSKLFKYDLNIEQESLFLSAETAGYDVSRIEWSADGQWAAFGLKAIGSQAGRQIFVSRENGEDFQRITNDSGAYHAGYHWSPTGNLIVFQKYELGAADARPKISLWDMTKNTTTVITENGALPVWLP